MILSYFTTYSASSRAFSNIISYLPDLEINLVRSIASDSYWITSIFILGSPIFFLGFTSKTLKICPIQEILCSKYLAYFLAFAVSVLRIL